MDVVFLVSGSEAIHRIPAGATLDPVVINLIILLFLLPWLMLGIDPMTPLTYVLL